MTYIIKSKEEPTVFYTGHSWDADMTLAVRYPDQHAAELVIANHNMKAVVVESNDTDEQSTK